MVPSKQICVLWQAHVNLKNKPRRAPNIYLDEARSLYFFLATKHANLWPVSSLSQFKEFKAVTTPEVDGWMTSRSFMKSMSRLVTIPKNLGVSRAEQWALNWSYDGK